jgi:hypothetical protein
VHGGKLCLDRDPGEDIPQPVAASSGVLDLRDAMNWALVTHARTFKENFNPDSQIFTLFELEDA